MDRGQYVIGFLMGGFFGLFVECLLTLPCGLLYSWFGHGRIEPAWWMAVLLVPIPVWLGLVMGKAIASMHLEDY